MNTTLTSKKINLKGPPLAASWTPSRLWSTSLTHLFLVPLDCFSVYVWTHSRVFLGLVSNVQMYFVMFCLLSFPLLCFKQAVKEENDRLKDQLEYTRYCVIFSYVLASLYFASNRYPALPGWKSENTQHASHPHRPPHLNCTALHRHSNIMSVKVLSFY